MRQPKESMWKMSAPASFRFWMKRSMAPMGYDKALKKKQFLAIGYFFASLATLNAVVYQSYKQRRESDNVAPEHEIMQTYLSTTPPVQKDENRQAYIFNYENLKFKGKEEINTKEMEKMRDQ